jgi:hypothetical protein
MVKWIPSRTFHVQENEKCEITHMQPSSCCSKLRVESEKRPVYDGTGKEVLPQGDITILSLPLLQEADKRICKTVYSLNGS